MIEARFTSTWEGPGASTCATPRRLVHHGAGTDDVAAIEPS